MLKRWKILVAPPEFPDTTEPWEIKTQLASARDREEWVRLARALRRAGYHAVLWEQKVPGPKAVEVDP